MLASLRRIASLVAAAALVTIGMRWLYVTFALHYRFQYWPLTSGASISSIFLAAGLIRRNTVALLISATLATLTVAAALWVQIDGGFLNLWLLGAMVAAAGYVALIAPPAVRALTIGWSGRDR